VAPETESPPPLIDRLRRPLRDLRISVTDRCNFRCPYCMPREVFGPHHNFLPRSEILTFEELQRLTRLFHRLGYARSDSPVASRCCARICPSWSRC